MQILPRDIVISLALVLGLELISQLRSGKKILLPRFLAVALLAAIMAALFSLTGVSPISGFHTDIRLDQVAYIPFKGILSILNRGLDAYAVRNIFGNILMFAPLGFFLPLLWRKYRRLVKTALFGFGVSLLIECTQLFLTRGTDVDDLILNTVGVMLGYLAYAVFQRLLPRFSQRFLPVSKARAGGGRAWAYVLIPYAVIVLLGFCDRAALFM